MKNGIFYKIGGRSREMYKSKNIYILLLILISVVFLSVQAVESVSYKWKNVKIGGGGGFVPGIVFNENEKDLIYARTDIGGAYRWNSEKERWVPLTDWVSAEEWNLLGIESLATDPVDPDRLYLAAGTYTNSWTAMNGFIMRSTDRGETFERIELPFKLGGNMPGRSMGERLVIDPNENSILYLGARSGNGLWKSTDYGETWNQVANFPNTGLYVENPDYEYNSDPVGVVWITFDTRSSSFGYPTKDIFVGVADNQEDCIYCSIDAGQSWEAVPGQPVGFLPHHGVISPDGILYISYSDGAGPYDGEKGEVWKYNINTGIWTDISPVSYSSEDNYFGYGGLAVDKQNPDIIMVATLNAWWPDEIIYRSTDGGLNWSPIWEWGIYPERIMRYNHDISAAPWLDWGSADNIQLPEVRPKLGWMIGDLEIDPFNSDRMMYGTGATIYGSNDLKAWDKGEKITIEVKAVGIEETAVTGLISPPEGAYLVSVMGDICGFCHDELDVVQDAFHVPEYGTTTGIDFAELAPNFMVIAAKAEAGSFSRVAFSYDGGNNWFKASNDPVYSEGGGLVAVSANASKVVWVAENSPIYYTTDNGSTWAVSSGIPDNSFVISDRVNPEIFYGFSNGRFYISTDGGISFTVTAETGLPDSTKIKAIPGIEGDIWLAGGADGLWYSSNKGTSFFRIDNVTVADTVGFGKAAPGKEYMAIYITGKINGVYGIFRSDDRGQSWVRINDDQHQYGSINYSITGDPRVYGRVYVATNGRGIVYGDPAGDIPVVIPGDVNGDGAVNVSDYVILRRFLLKMINDEDVMLENADINRDGDVDVLDYNLLRRLKGAI